MIISYQHCHATVSLGTISEGLVVALALALTPSSFTLIVAALEFYILALQINTEQEMK